MILTFPRAARSLAALGAVVLAATACGSGSSSGGSAAGGSIGKSYQLSGAEFTVAGKEFTEQQVLAHITANALEAAGAKVKIQSLTGSDTVRTALTSGRIDMYWEYDGTAWLSYLKHTDPIKDPQQQYQSVASADLAQNHIKWLTPAKFSDAYGVAMSGQASGPLAQVNTISDMAALVHAHPDLATFCGAAEFINRNDGLPAFEQAYGFKFPASNIKTVDLAIDYTAVAKGDPCNFAEIFTTDGRIQTLKLKVLTDDKAAFGSYVPALNVRDEVYKKYAKQLDGIAADLGKKLDTPTMQELNKEVDVDGMTAADVAKKWMSKNGFTS